MTTALSNADHDVPAILQPYGLDSAKLEIIREQIAPGAPDDVLALYFERCRFYGADPFAKMIYPIPRKQRAEVPARDGVTGELVIRNGKQVMVWDDVVRWTFQSSIDFFRATAESAEGYAGQDGPYWCGEDGAWKDVWLSKKAPIAARVGVYRDGFAAPMYAVALFSEYAQQKNDGTLMGLWKTMPALMLAKCAEALALRKAFPRRLGGIYTSDEMQQAENGQESGKAAVLEGAETPPKSRGTRNQAQAALPPASEPVALVPTILELQARFKELQPEGKFLAWIREHKIIDLVKDPSDGQYHPSEDQRRTLVAALDALATELQASVPEEFEDAEFSESAGDAPAAVVDADECTDCCRTAQERAEKGGHVPGCPADPRAASGSVAQTPNNSDATPSDFATSSTTSPRSKGDSTRAQHAKIALAAKDLGMTDDERHAEIAEMFPGATSSTQLSKAEASKYIEHLNRLLAGSET